MMDRTIFRVCVITWVMFEFFPSIFANHNFELICAQFRKVVKFSGAEYDIEFFFLHTIQLLSLNSLLTLFK